LQGFSDHGTATRVASFAGSSGRASTRPQSESAWQDRGLPHGGFALSVTLL
jgi:hypothetical protein